MKLAHITIDTANLEKSVEFYKNVCGLKVNAEMKNGPMHIVFLANADGETAVELIENKSAPKYENAPSMGFHTADVEKLHKELTEKGYSPTPVISPNPAVKFFFVQDPNGVKIQFI